MPSIAEENPPTHEAKPITGLYGPQGAPRGYLLFIQITAVLALVATGFALYGSLVCKQHTFLRGMWAIWVVGPPVWFAFEYFYLYRVRGSAVEFNQFKTAQDVMAKLWLAVVALLSGILAAIK